MNTKMQILFVFDPTWLITPSEVVGSVSIPPFFC